MKNKIIYKYVWEKLIVMLDNANIHKKWKIVNLESKISSFVIPSYTPELNQIENTFGILIIKISNRKLNEKQLKQIVIGKKATILLIN